MLRITFLTVLLLLLTEGFIVEALKVTTKEGQADWAIEAVNQMIDQGKLLFTTILSIL